MRYLGGKSRLAPAIYDFTRQVAPTVDTLTDLFVGSGALSSYFKERGFKVVVNDLLFFSYAMARGSLVINRKPSFRKLHKYLGQDPMQFLNTCTLPAPDSSQSIRLSYSPDSTPARKYLTRQNALRIDFARQQIEEWKSEGFLTVDEYFYLLAAIIAGVPFVSNITGTYGAFLKYWDQRALNPYAVTPMDVLNNGQRNRAYNMDGLALLGRISGQLLYLDPPYNERQYLPNYHVLETVARYDNPVVAGTTGQRLVGTSKSDFCSKKTALRALEDVIAAAQFEHIVLSYNNEGIIATDELSPMLRRYAVPGSPPV